jgi:hypothetical protein
MNPISFSFDFSETFASQFKNAISFTEKMDSIPTTRTLSSRKRVTHDQRRNVSKCDITRPENAGNTVKTREMN